MKKRTVSLLCCALLLVCLTAQAEIPFANEQLYAVACVGYGDDVALADYRGGIWTARPCRFTTFRTAKPI